MDSGSRERESSHGADVFRRLDRDGRLSLRVYVMALPSSGEEVQTVSQPPVKAPGASRFEIRAVKLFIDGAMGSRGALLFEFYHDDPDCKGLLLIEPRVLEATTVAAPRNGWQVATHAIGDRAVALVLDPYEAALKVDGAHAWRWFLDAKVPLAFGSDFPVEIVNPLLGLYAAVTRQDAEGRPEGDWHPAQKLSVDEALRAFTAGAAFAEVAEDRVDVLKPGMHADVTIFDRDLFREPSQSVPGGRVLFISANISVIFDAKWWFKRLAYGRCWIGGLWIHWLDEDYARERVRPGCGGGAGFRMG